MKVLIIGHACSPRQGSEPSFTWNWAWHLSQYHRVWVVAHPHDRGRVQTFLDDHPRRNLTFHWVTVPKYLDTWRPTRDDRGLRLHYLLWLRLARRKAGELQKQVGFDIVHHVGYGSVSAPFPVRKLGVPFIWGPLGGAQHAPPSFRRYFGWTWTREVLRSARVRLLPLSRSLRSAARASCITLATNDETANLLWKIGARDVRLCLDSGVPSAILSKRQASRSYSEALTLLWVGRMEARKALPLALEALAEVADLNVKLLIAGDGEMRRSWEDCAQRLGVEPKVQFLGKVGWEEMPDLYLQADALLFTSLRDSFGMQLLEAMGHGLPIVTLDHQGAGTFVPSDAAIKVPVTTPAETVNGLAEGIRWLAQDPQARQRMGERGRAFARTQTWERRARWMSQLYEEVLSTQPSPHLGGPAPYGSYAVRKRMAKIDESLDLTGKRVLDLGCGNGCYTAELARRAAYVCGIDIQMPHLRSFRQPIPRVQAAGENLPLANESFDVVTMIEVLEHTRNDSEVLRECFRVLKPGGQLVLFVPNKLYPFESHPCRLANFSIGRNVPLISWFPESLRKHLCDARIYARRRLFSLAHSAGFQDHTRGYIFPPLDSLRLPFKEGYRRVARRLEKSPLARVGVSIYAVFQKPALPVKTEPAVTPGLQAGKISFDVLGVRVDAVQIADVTAQIERWIHDRSACHSIAATSMHGIVEAQRNPLFREILNSTDLVVPDGMPLVWLGRHQGYRLRRRVYGPDLMLALCEKSIAHGYRHFFYGGEPGVPERLAESLTARFPGLQIAGTFSPPFRLLSADEDEEIVSLISRAAPDVLWVGLGAPRQERWMHEHRGRLQVPVQVGVGAAFDLLSGRRRQAPRWMREHCLEWCFRLFQEPRRLWRRYLVYGAQFVGYVAAESLREFWYSRRARVTTGRRAPASPPPCRSFSGHEFGDLPDRHIQG